MSDSDIVKDFLVGSCDHNVEDAFDHQTHTASGRGIDNDLEFGAPIGAGPAANEVVLKRKTGRKITAPFRILVVDDSVVMRKLLGDTLSADPELEVVGWACDGKVALAKFAQLRPDLITLDLEMPVMNGLQTLVEIRKVDRSIPVIIFSMLTESE